MAVGSISETSGTGNKVAGTPATATITASVGDSLIVVAGSDNLSGAAEAMPEGSVTDSSGNTWARLLFLGGSGSSGAHAAIAIFGCIVTNALTGGTITLTPNATVAAKGFTVHRYTGLSLTVRGLNTGAVTATTPAALSTSTPVSGDLVIAASVLEGPTSDTWTPDTDTTLGSWSAVTTSGTTGGTATGNIAIRSQHKIVNATGTQTYNGSNSVSRDMCRGIIALVPSPAPPSAPEPSAYVPKYSRITSTGRGRMTAGQVDCYSIGENFNPELPPVIYGHGAGSDAAMLSGFELPGHQPIVQALTDMGFAVVGASAAQSYGNAAAMTSVTNAVTFARNTLGCSTKPIAMLGTSMGGTTAMTYAYNNPTLVACIVGLIPIIDLAEMVEQDTLGLASAVLAAWSVAALPLPAGADPNTAGHRATLAQIPMQHWYATDDAVSANITSFQQATGCDVRAVGPYGHSDESIRRSWPTDIARFIRKRVGVPYNVGDLH